MDKKLYRLNRQKDGVFYIPIKRFLDIFISLIALLLITPIFLIIGIIIRIETPGSPIFDQIRLGKNKKPFVIYKFRSMHKGSHKGIPSWTSENDDRITKVGRIIRKYHIDELPQLINVLKGDMSIIGPRPEVPLLSEKFEYLYPEYVFRTTVKPGITGWAQVNGGYNLNAEQKGILDYYYVKNQSFYLDFVIIIKTIVIVLQCKDVR